MDNDLGISEALAALFEFAKEINILMNENSLGKNDSEKIIGFLREIDSVIGVMKFEEESLDEEIQKLIDERNSARKNKDFKRADEIRKILSDKGIVLEDTSHGTRWKKA